MPKYEKKGDVSYAIGTTVAVELLQKKPEVARRLYISGKLDNESTLGTLESLAKKAGIEIIRNNEKIFHSLSGKENVMAIAEFSKWQGKPSEGENHVMLVNPSNMGNVGTIMRTCLAFGVRDMVFIGPCADLFDPKTVRASMGAIFSLDFKIFESLEEYLSAYGKDRTCYPFMLQAKEKLGENKPEGKWTLIFGNEARGLPENYLHVGIPTIIPITKDVDSINLDNAASIAIYQFTKGTIS